MTKKETLYQVQDECGGAITQRGSFIPPGRKPQAGERKLFLLIESHNLYAVKKTKDELLRILEEETARVGFDMSQFKGKYNVV